MRRITKMSLEKEAEDEDVTLGLYKHGFLLCYIQRLDSNGFES